jgi:hypothetical protein
MKPTAFRIGRMKSRGLIVGELQRVAGKVQDDVLPEIFMAAQWGGGLDLLTALGAFRLKSPPRHSAVEIATDYLFQSHSILPSDRCYIGVDRKVRFVRYFRRLRTRNSGRQQ